MPHIIFKQKKHGETMNCFTISRFSLTVLMAITLGACGSDNDSSPGDTTGGGTTAGTTDGGTTDGGTTDGGTTDGGTTGGGQAEDGISRNTIDRMGRPGVSTALVAAGADKDAYNIAGDPAQWSALFFENIRDRADIIDDFDGVRGNALLGSSTTLADLLVDDRLQIDTLQPTCGHYLALEIQLQDGGCGGRRLEIDVIDDTLQHLVSQTEPVMDLAEHDSDTTDAWPFLAAPN